MAGTEPVMSIRLFILSFMVVPVLVGAIGCRQETEDPVSTTTKQQTKTPIPDAARLLEQKLRAVGLLENLPNDDQNDGSECVDALAKLAAALPEEALGPRNLAIARLLILEKLIFREEQGKRERTGEQEEELEDPQTAFLNAQEAVEKARACEGDSPTVRMLAAHLANFGIKTGQFDDPQRVITAFTAAAEASPDDPRVWSEFYHAADEHFDEASRAARRNALRRAWELRPENLRLLMEWMLTQAETRDPTIVRTLEAARTVLQPLAASLEQRGVKLIPRIDETIAAVESEAEDAWRTVLINVRPLVNVVRPDIAYQMDRLRTRRHVLEYVIHDFSPEFYERVHLPDPDPPQATVRFVAPPDGSQLPADLVVKDLLLADCDRNDRPDVVLLTEDRVEVWTQNPDRDGWQSRAEVTVGAGIDRLRSADLDRDYDLDFIVSGTTGLRVLRNQYDGEQVSLISTQLDEALEQLIDVRSLGIADLEHDGDLDLVVSGGTGLSLWSNHGNFDFANVTGQSSWPPSGIAVSSIVPVDWNQDVAIDLVIAGGPSTDCGVLENVFHNRFRWRSFELPRDSIDGATALAVEDVDGNLSWDLLVGGVKGITLTRTEIAPTGRVHFLPAESVSSSATTGLQSCDFDNDGYRDLFAWGPDGLSIFRGGPRGQYREEGDMFTDSPDSVRACRTGDIDQDGDLDLFIIEGGRARVHVNEGGNANHSIDVTLHTEKEPKFANQRTNSFGIGSFLELKTGPIYQSQVVTGQSTHFGLGQRDHADLLRILFTNGIPQNVIRPTAGPHVQVLQRILMGSCPYLYTWSGERYEFFTDCLWAAPIGLQFAEGVLAVPRVWEYLLIPGERLVERDGEYHLQITEELWEAAYFDQVQLLAVDHPADVEIYSNEKVGPAEIASFRIHSVRNKQTPVAARDQHQRDVLPKIADRDDMYLRAFDRRFTQGLTEEQIIELDFGSWNEPDRFTLFLTGWIFPTDTSLNVAISQNSALPAPQPPSLWVPDEEGEWKQVIPYTGFPGGKTKTIAIDLPADLFSDDDYRIRLVTNMELYWDEIFFTVDEQPTDYRLTEIPPMSADLHYRGFSGRVEHPENGPESYDYEDVSEEPYWPPMRGRFTRYGDVTELVRDPDDLLVVLGAGDEMTLRFRVPQNPPPDGWKRDFLLYNVGWDKDANLNTVLGQTVEPLPFRSMQRYPYPSSVSPPDSPRYRRYLQTWQTRRQNRAGFWKQVRNASGHSD